MAHLASETDRTIHRLKWFYKIMNNLAPDYLKELIPPPTEERHAYGLRSRENITTFRAHRQCFRKSFFPSTVKDWNTLPIDIRHSPSLHTFNHRLKLHISSTPKRPWYGQGHRFADIHHTRMRIGCSKLKAHLHFNLHVEDNPFCRCSQTIEDPYHYFFSCPLYNQSRVI